MSLLFSAYTTPLLLLNLLVLASLCSPISSTHENNNSECTPSCGNIKISSPFRLSGDPPNCGDKLFELFCEGEGGEGIDTVLYLFSGKYLVVAINYSDFTIRVVDAALHNNIKHNPFSNPLYSLATFNFTDAGLHSVYDRPIYPDYYSSTSIILVSCERPMIASSSGAINVDAAPCLGDTRSSYSYFMVPPIDRLFAPSPLDWGESCKITLMYRVDTSTDNDQYMMNTCQGIYDKMAKGFQLTWLIHECSVRCGSVEDCQRNYDGGGIYCSSSTAPKERRWYMKSIKFISQKLGKFRLLYKKASLICG